MAVTIHDTPQDFTPSDNPVAWTFSSDQTGQDNFSFLVKVYINDTLIANELIFPDNGIYGRFNAQDYASNNCSIPAISTDIVTDAANYCDVRITVVERYGDPVANGASAAATNVTCWKSRMNDHDFVDWDYTRFAMNIYTKEDWLTNYPTTDDPKVRQDDESKFLMCINNGNDLDLKVELFDADGASIASDTYNFAASGEYFLICNLSPDVIVSNTTINATDFDYADYMIVSDVVHLNNYTIDIDASHIYDRNKRIHFLSQWGTIESFTFGLISRVSAKVNSYGYTKGWGSWNGSSFQYTKAQGTTVDYAKRVTPKMEVESDFLSEGEQNYLTHNCIGSPLVYEESGDNLIRRKITTAKFEDKIQENDMVFTLKIDLALKQIDSMTI